MNIFKGKFANIKSISTTKAALQKPNRKSPIVKDIAEFRHNDYGSEVRMQNYPEDRLVSQLKPTKHLELEEVSGLAYGKSLRPKNVNLDIEANVEPLEIELSDDEIVHHRTNNKALEIKKDKLDHMKKNNRMDVYNELKLSVLNKDKKLKNKLDETNVGELNQMAYAPQSYFRDDATSGIKSLAGTPGGSKPFSPKVSFSNQNTALRLNGDPCCPDMSCLPKAVKCNPCCRTFDGRDLAFVFLFGLVVGLLSIIAMTLLYSVFCVFRRSCCSSDPYEITLTRDHHYPEECKVCYKCKKCCDCCEDSCFKRCRVNPRLLDGSLSDAIPTSKWRLCPTRNRSCQPLGTCAARTQFQ